MSSSPTIHFALKSIQKNLRQDSLAHVSLQRLVELIKAERLYIDFQGCDRIGNVKLLQHSGMYDSKLSYPLPLDKDICMSAREEARAVSLLPTVASIEQLLL